MLRLPFFSMASNCVLVPMPSKTEKKERKTYQCIDADHVGAKKCKHCLCLVNLFLCPLYSDSLQITQDAIVFFKAVCVIRNRE